MLAKSMIMMNSEIHKERMKPENIYADIGRDQFEYINDKYIGTGKELNKNIFDNERTRPAFQDQKDLDSETLMRASGPAGEIRSTGSFAEPLNSPATENVATTNEYSNVEVLQKEFALGKDLLEKAIENIDQDGINRLANYHEATRDDLNSANVFFKMLAMLDNQEAKDIENWKDIEGFNQDVLQKLQNVPEKIENRNFDKGQVDILRDEFQMKNQEDENEDIKNLKEFL
jgi:hypothetical protein